MMSYYRWSVVESYVHIVLTWQVFVELEHIRVFIPLTQVCSLVEIGHACKFWSISSLCLLYSCQTYSLLWKPPARFTPQTQPPHTHDVLWTSSWPYDKGWGEVKRKKQENDESTHFSSWWQKKCLQNPSSVWKLSAHWSGDRTLLLLSEAASAEKRRLVGKAPQAWRLLNQLSRYFVSAWICDRIVSMK